jgi:signal transduction histidine kinase
LEEVNRLQYLSDNLIKVTQYNKSAKKVNISKFLIGSAVKNAIQVVGSLSKHKQIKIIQGGKDFNITDNKDTITELLVIFLDNAIKYSPKKTSIKLLTSKQDGKYELSISDKGFGISDEDIPHIFDRFYRSDKSRTNDSSFGYGLGLSIAKEIIDQRNGNINVISKIGKGTKFTVKLPVMNS